METLTIGITTQDIVVITIKNMDISLRTTFEHISVEIIIDGLVKPHVLVVTRLVISENRPTRSKAPNYEFDKGKTKVEHIRSEMNRTWKRKDTKSTSNGEGITSPNGSSGHTSSN